MHRPIYYVQAVAAWVLVACSSMAQPAAQTDSMVTIDAGVIEGVVSGGGRTLLIGGGKLTGGTPEEPSADQIGENFANSVGIEGAGSRALEALRALPAATVCGELDMSGLLKGAAGPPAAPTYGRGPIFGGGGVIATPGEILRRGEAARVPIMIGSTTQDLPVVLPPSPKSPLAYFGAEADKAHAQSSPEDTTGELSGTSWQLVKFQGGDDTVLTPDAKAKYTITFEPDGHVSVRIDCNRGRGTWTSSGPNHLQLGPLALTRAMCPPDSLHDHIVKQWAFVRSYTIKDGHLFLSLMADGGVYEFEPLLTKG
jgi:heat shock protein HslJ